MTLRNAFGNLALDSNLTAAKNIVQAVRDRMETRFLVGNARSKFRDGFATAGAQPNPDMWNILNESPDPVGGIGTPGSGLGHIVEQGGDAAGSSYLRISMSPFDDDCSFWMTTKDTFRLPTRLGFGVTSSQRVVGQELFYGVVQAGASDPSALGLQRTDPIGEIAITSATVTVTSNVLTIPVGFGHPFKSGDRVLVRGCADTRLNVAPVVVGTSDSSNITVPLTITNGTYNSTGGYVRNADPVTRGYNAVGMLLENSVQTNATFAARRNGTKPRMRNNAIVTTQANLNAAGNWNDSLIAPGVTELLATMDESSFRSWSADSVTAGNTGYDRFSQSVADEELDYRIVIRARNLDELSRPIARITNIAKSGTTTATVTTDVPHGLTTSSRVGIAGVRDATNFPYTSDQAVLSVPTSTTFTVTVGSAVTASDANGGVVFINHGQVASPGAFAVTVQSVARANGVLSVVFNTSAANIIGETYQLHGFNSAARALEGAYRCVRINGSTAEFEALGATVAAITTGGACIRRTDYRIHFTRILDHTRHMVEVMGGRGSNNDVNNAVPVLVNASSIVNVQPRALFSTSEALTSTALAASGTYTQTGTDTSSDTPSRPTRVRTTYMATAAALGSHAHLVFQESTDNSTFRETARVPLPADGNYHTNEFTSHLRYYRFLVVNGPTAQTALFLTTQFLRTDGLAPDARSVVGFPLTPLTGTTLAASASITGQTIDLGANHCWDRLRMLWRQNDSVAATTYTGFLQWSPDGATWFNHPTAISTSTSATAASFASEMVVAGMRYVRGVITNNSATAGGGAQIAALALIPA